MLGKLAQKFWLALKNRSEPLNDSSLEMEIAGKLVEAWEKHPPLPGRFGEDNPLIGNVITSKKTYKKKSPAFERGLRKEEK